MRREVRRRGRERQHRGHVDDRAAVRGAEEIPHGRPIGVEQRRQVQVERLLPAFIGELVERTVAEPPAAAAGDVEHAVDAAEPLERGGEHTVWPSAGSVASPRTQGVSGPRRSAAVAAYAVVASSHRHLRAFAQARERGRQAHAGRPADDHDRQAIETPGLHARQCGTGIHPRQSLLHYGACRTPCARPSSAATRSLRGSSSRPDTWRPSAPTMSPRWWTMRSRSR